MVSSNIKIVYLAFVVVALFAMVQSYESNSDFLKSIKRGIILRCQGNPVSCYGKRSLTEDPLSSAIIDGDIETASQEKQEMAYEKYAENLIKNCRMGVNKDCNRVLKIMLMNNPN
ncbi:unnamed protein product [Brachionus calyciflorus]|uniref:Uncharacterized protein n=1 Tax=Brachionus calyciflorus TaxID=104777 RepID=A0A813PK06_9BILA|nr:unnamed protein product [Brachionus calyciflorus]